MLAGDGIRFNHPLSRVHTMAGWRGQKLYPTQFYSILVNVAVFFLLWRLLRLQAPAVMIASLYLIISGAARFVEESLRGEPQTQYWLGMRAYQWLAILSVCLGIALSALPSTPLPDGETSTMLWLHAGLFALLITVVYGVDMPESNKRFSRLS